MDYDLEYFERMLRLNSKTAEEICDIRWRWISEVIHQSHVRFPVILDYGSGVGWFRAYRPSGTEVYTFDIGRYPQTGIPMKRFDVICFWDVLEHVRDFTELEAPIALSGHVALSIPIVKEGDLYQSKHFKPGEHLHYWTENTVEALFRKYGFDLIRKGMPECPPRQDVKSFLFGRRQNHVVVSSPI